MPVHYECAGEGLPLVLLHGIGSNSRSWRRQLSELSKDFKVIAWDAPGYGESSDPPPVIPSMREYVESLRGLLDSLNLGRVALLGHSMGGVIAQEFYRSYPEHLRALILADTSYGGPREKWEERIRMVRTITPAELAAQRAPKLLSARAPQDVVREAISIMAEVRPAGYEFAAKAMASADTRGVLRDITIPTMLIWGADDEITPLWQDVPPRARLEILPNAGHLCYTEQPERFNAIVRNFLKELNH